MPVSPRPWTFSHPAIDSDSTDQGQIIDANGEIVCHFGDAEQYYPVEGCPPDEDNLRFLLEAVNNWRRDDPV